MATCKKCGKVSHEIAKVLSLCADCLRQADDLCLAQIGEIHAQSRIKYGLPARPPAGGEGVDCYRCQNQCRIPPGERGYCGVRKNVAGQIKGGGPLDGMVCWYHDPLPTNCVADWVCAGGTETGYPSWSYKSGPEVGYANLAVFYEACTFNCLFCQNWHYRHRSTLDQSRTAAELAKAVTAQTSCVCFFGGDPTPQIQHALNATQLARKQNDSHILRICWETNGSMAPKLLDEMLNLSLVSGGCVKIDLKAMDANIHFALCGASNHRTLENFATAALRIHERPEPPLLVASTLLVPGYIDEKEVKAIASFIADLDVNIPYALLGFHGDFLMADLPRTTREQAERCLAAAKEAGLTRVRIGNEHILR